jgi:hypothetical protein
MPSSPVARPLLAIATSLLLALVPSRSRAQQPSEASVCLGFAFGAWTPTLDWRGAGHQTLDPSLHQRADDGRDWATTQSVDDEHTIILLPSWWPAGVSVTLPTRSPTLGDTVVGHAFAYVADGRLKVPTSQVRAWRVPCTPRAH